MAIISWTCIQSGSAKNYRVRTDEEVVQSIFFLPHPDSACMMNQNSTYRASTLPFGVQLNSWVPRRFPARWMSGGFEETWVWTVSCIELPSAIGNRNGQGVTALAAQCAQLLQLRYMFARRQMYWHIGTAQTCNRIHTSLPLASHTKGRNFQTYRLQTQTPL